MGSLKNLTFKGRFTRNQYRGGRLPKKGELGLFADLRRIGKKERGGDFPGVGLRPQCPQWHLLRSVYVNKFCKSTRNGCLTDSWKYFCTINALFVGFFSVFNYKFLVSKMIMRWLLFRICKHSNSWWVLPKTVLKTNIAFKKLIYLLLNAIVNLFKYTKFLLPHFLIHCHEELKIFANLVL